jgi:hypothetical protein
MISDGGEDLEVQQRQATGLADLLHVFHAGNAQHHGAEDDRAMIILISLMKPSPSGFIWVARSGEKWPSSTPSAMANSTWT